MAAHSVSVLNNRSAAGIRMGTNTSTDAATAPWLPFLLQTADALFPTGAYAHSLGFEECVRLDLVRDEPSLHQYLALHILPALQNQELPYLRFAHEAAGTGNLEVLCSVDQEIGAWKLASETRAASMQVGRRRLHALCVAASDPRLAAFEACIQSGAAEGHHLSVCALQALAGQIPLGAALTAYAYQALAGICAAAMKLIRIGQDGCQRVLHGVTQKIPSIVGTSLSIPREKAGWFDPILEIASMRHEHAEERLFIS
jgi:urease accessory protein